ncbi:MAG: hypothetical protein V5A45_04925 [Haloarculaceae archaeon]
MTDDRSERLRKRRKQSAQQAEDNRQSEITPAESGTTSQESARQGTPGNDDADDESEDATSIKENQVGTYMYLPESQTKDLRRLYNVLKAEYEFKYDEEFEKNRHFYPLVIQFGLDSLDSMDASEIQTRLRELR